MLPPNLVSLELVGCAGNALPSFAGMFLALLKSIREGRFQDLRRIKFQPGSVPKIVAETYFDDLALAEKYAELGVAFTYQPPIFEYSSLTSAIDRLWERGRTMDHSFLEISGMSNCGPFDGALPMPLPDDDVDDDL
ncbi:hypothetical protein PFICI_04571 [Pestalotiopsis fici W106-1]|uniref:Uncharacterized protein n=1 Tax=Pestalotiopsis fici (strain W106-1 / CGMCC3.15140) TaxID=1229662 RepID=W3X9F6_PESFW|nr:uncharacterized protein PFICI_04571 [Pestalotiopsis fici W106-1]ETS82695.1 hypothetical protein PFICI_04571 [Pestalotiopsis fici W106-1]